MTFILTAYGWVNLIYLISFNEIDKKNCEITLRTGVVDSETITIEGYSCDEYFRKYTKTIGK